jgi:hypothetical protein
MGPTWAVQAIASVQVLDVLHPQVEDTGDGEQVRRARARSSGFPAKDGSRSYIDCSREISLAQAAIDAPLPNTAFVRLFHCSGRSPQ